VQVGCTKLCQSYPAGRRRLSGGPRWLESLLVFSSWLAGVQPDTSAVDHLKAAANTAAKRMSHVHHYKPTPRHVVVVCLVRHIYEDPQPCFFAWRILYVVFVLNQATPYDQLMQLCTSSA
jgi:hypothetical protein